LVLVRQPFLTPDHQRVQGYWVLRALEPEVVTNRLAASTAAAESRDPSTSDSTVRTSSEHSRAEVPVRLRAGAGGRQKCTGRRRRRGPGDRCRRGRSSSLSRSCRPLAWADCRSRETSRSSSARPTRGRCFCAAQNFACLFARSARAAGPVKRWGRPAALGRCCWAPSRAGGTASAPAGSAVWARP